MENLPGKGREERKARMGVLGDGRGLSLARIPASQGRERTPSAAGAEIALERPVLGPGVRTLLLRAPAAGPARV